MGDWGEYKNNSIPTNRTNEETEARRLHYLCQDREINLSRTRIFPLTSKGEASEEFWVMWKKYMWRDKGIRFDTEFPTMEEWRKFKVSDLKKICSDLGITQSGTKNEIYNRIFHELMGNLIDNSYLPLTQLMELMPVFSVSTLNLSSTVEERKKDRSLCLDEKMLKKFSGHLYFTPETFNLMIRQVSAIHAVRYKSETGLAMLLGSMIIEFLCNPQFDLKIVDIPNNWAKLNQVCRQVYEGSMTSYSYVIEDESDQNPLQTMFSRNQTLSLADVNYLLKDSQEQSVNDLFMRKKMTKKYSSDEEITLLKSLCQNPCVPDDFMSLITDSIVILSGGQDNGWKSMARNPNLGDSFIMEHWDKINSEEVLLTLLTHNQFLPPYLINYLLGLPINDSSRLKKGGGRFEGFALAEGRNIMSKLMTQYHFPEELYTSFETDKTYDDKFRIKSWKGQYFEGLAAINLAANPNVKILAYALKNYPVFTEGSNPRYLMARNPNTDITLIKTYYDKFDTDDVAQNIALPMSFIEDKSDEFFKFYFDYLLPNIAIFPYTFNEWQSGLFNWKF